MARISLALLLAALSVALIAPPPAAAQGFSLCRLMNYWDEEQVVVEGQTLQLEFCAPREQSVDAANMLALAVRALPVLDELTDVRLDGSHSRRFYLGADQQLSALNADGAIDEQNRILLHGGSLDSTVVHELAHYWADQDRFSELWMVEAYAEYLTSLAMPRLGERYIPRTTPASCAKTPLIHWGRTLRGAEVCPYSTGVQVFQDLAALAGEDTLRRVIGEVSRDYGRVDSRQLLHDLEQASSVNLSPLMRGRVFGPEDNAWLDARAALHERYAAAAGRAAALGAALPPALADDLRGWRDDKLAGDLAQLEALLDAAELTGSRCAGLDLPCARPWAQGLGDPARWEELRGFFAGAPQPLSAYEELRTRAGELGMAVPESLRQRAGALDEGATLALQNALAVLTAAGAFEGRCATLGLSCRGTWQGQWERGELETVQGVLASFGAAFDAGQALEGRCGDLAGRCRALWQEAIAQGGAAGVQRAAAELDELLADGAAVAARCGGLAAQCGGLWRAALRDATPDKAREQIDELRRLLERGEALGASCGEQAAVCKGLWGQELAAGSLTNARGQMAALEDLLARADEIEASCSKVGWPCARGWRAALAQHDLARAEAVLTQQDDTLAGLVSIEDAVAAGEWPLLAWLRGAGVGDPFAVAKETFARGEVDAARRLAAAVRDDQTRRQQSLVAAATLGTFLVATLLVAILIVTMRLGARPAASRRPAQVTRQTPPAPPAAARRAAPGPDVLTQLLSAPPEEQQP